jgi:hypothetical protein
MNTIAERYVKLILGIGDHDRNYVDAYYGPKEWKPASRSPRDLAQEAADLALSLRGAAGVDLSRLNFLLSQIASAQGRIAMLGGRKFSFDEEAKTLYGVEPPSVSESDLEQALRQVDQAIPGSGTLIERYARLEARFRVPPERLDRTFRAAIAEARQRTRRHIPALPAKESFEIEYVKGKSWSAYNWYKGEAHSLIQVNVDQPIAIDRVLHFACHEGYPGHHVYNALLEANLVRDRGWWEYSIYPLYSPQSLLAEGTADYGNHLVLAGRERLEFKRDVLFREAGLDPAAAEEQHRSVELVRPLRHAAILAARQYLDGRKDAAATVAILERYTLQNRALAERRLRFFDEHRSYVINYSFGEDLVANWISKTAGSDVSQRWNAFTSLLDSPRTPANLL